jgi:hypothetical protein
MLNTDFGATGWVLKSYVLDVYPNLVQGVKTPGLFVWGGNASGQLGDNTVASKSSPVQTIASGIYTWRQVACNKRTAVFHTAALKVDNTLWVWGDNATGQLGDNSVAKRSSPVQTVAAGTNWRQVACGGNHMAGVKSDGTLWLWGGNTSGQLGDNTATSRSSPVQTISAGTAWLSVSCGYAHTAALKSDGTMWAWGLNTAGQLGDNSATSRSSPVQTVTASTTWTVVGCGYRHTAGVKSYCTLWLWGSNTIGQLGDNTITSRSSPVQTVAGGSTYQTVACGDAISAAIKTDGTLWLWGANTNGMLGDNTLTSRSSPIQTVAYGTNWKYITASGLTTASIKSDGTLWLWGHNASGQIGDNSVTKRSSPVQTTSGGSTWKQVACGYNHTVAIQDGTY